MKFPDFFFGGVREKFGGVVQGKSSESLLLINFSKIHLQDLSQMSGQLILSYIQGISVNDSVNETASRLCHLGQVMRC